MARIVLDERPIGCLDCPFYALFDCRYYRDDQIFPGYCEYITTPDELEEEKNIIQRSCATDGRHKILKNGQAYMQCRM